MGYGLDEEYVDQDDDYQSNSYSVWTDQSGRTYDIDKMATSHVTKILKRLKRGGFNYNWFNIHGDQWISVFERQLQKRTTRTITKGT